MQNGFPLLCLIDDDLDHLEAMSEFLSGENFRVVTFPSAKEFLARAPDLENYDLVISDINMPGGASGFDLCRSIRAREESVRLPIILITGNDPTLERVRGLEVGADEFIGKPFSPEHVIAKIKSLLEIRAREVQRLHELEMSKGLNAELGRFVSPNIASRMTTSRHQSFLQPHRAEVTVLFVDLRRFTAFAEKVEPEKVLEVLHQYYLAVGTAAMKYKGTLSHLAGDGIMVFFNDPEPIVNHREMAVAAALEAHQALMAQKKIWEANNYDIDFGMGLSEGFATIGRIGFDSFSQYSVIGTVSNFASRLCDEALNGQILISRRFLMQLQPNTCAANWVGEKSLKGIRKSVAIYSVLPLENQDKATG